MEVNISTVDQILTTDGIPLKISLKKTERKNKIKAFLLVFPLLLFIIVTFVVPIVDMLTRSIDDSLINEVYGKTFEEYKKWDKKKDKLPPEAVYKAIFEDIAYGDKLKIGRSITRMNYSKSGWKSLIRKTRRQIGKIVKSEELPTSYKDALIEINERWADPTFWYSMSQMLSESTPIYYWNAIDRTYDQEANIVMQPEERRMYVRTWIKTFKVGVYVTFFCLILGFPVAHLLANLPLRLSNILMIFVLLPFWTSLLVRTTAWIVMLQQNGVINDVLVWLGILSDEGRIQMVYNQTGTIIVMTQILLPFMILPLYSVMKVIPKSHNSGLNYHCFSKNQTGIPDHLLKQEPVLLTMDPGDVLFLTKLTEHSSIPNKGNKIRWSFDLRYNPIGDRTGRDIFPGFIAKSIKSPASRLRDYKVWQQSWINARAKVAEMYASESKPKFNRWDPNDPVCA